MMPLNFSNIDAVIPHIVLYYENSYSNESIFVG
jgi:hypothetical protein